ncbi:purine-cytosine permease family protein [Kushneria aurantia]|uniref:Purine-cytosine permease family protein n=1 Tax=Kushneria aurantia TaxID=504092 RepID=A0ABV6FZS9_9GAMM|nr:cytosine permease [Kushneria aurantia]
MPDKASEVDITGEDNARTIVPKSQRRKTWDVSIVAAGYCIAMSGLFTGAALMAGLTLNEVILSALMGNTILALYGGLVGAAGAREGLGTAMLSRHAFGRQGSKVVGLVLAITMLGWFAVQVGFFGNTINALFPDGGFLAQSHIAALWGGGLMIATAYLGYKGLSIVSRIAIPAVIITATWGAIVAVNSHGGWNNIASIKPEESFGLGSGIVMVVGSFAAGASAQADITRYAKDERAAWISTIFGYMCANTFVILAGFLTSVSTGTGDLPAAMVGLGLGAPALIVLIAAQWTTNDNNLYTSSLGLSALVKLKKSTIVLISGVVATIAGFFGMASYFIDWLIVLGITIPPMAGILIADYYVINRGKYSFGPGVRYNQWNLTTFVSWLIASIAAYNIEWGSGAINALALSFVIYIVLSRVELFRTMGNIGEYYEDSTGF